MCGIVGQISLTDDPIPSLELRLERMSEIIAHRGPDGQGLWVRLDKRVGLAHRRLSIIDLSKQGSQPMITNNGNVISYNGEIYNYQELRNSLKADWNFSSTSDTECILASYDKYGEDCLKFLRGMFSFALWDEKRERLFCARDRFGIKPFYYSKNDDIFSFASEAKAIVPFVDEIKTCKAALAEYLTFQYTIGEKTLFDGINQLLPGHALIIEKGRLKIWRYWDVNYEIDFDHSPTYFNNRLFELMNDSIEIHGRSDVPVASYVSGGVDSALIYRLSKKNTSSAHMGFHGRFLDYPGYDESHYAKIATEKAGGELFIKDISSNDFEENLRNVIYHLDFPVAGPGAFPQYMVSQLAAEKVKVILGGQGGDELFGGYARYLLAYFEQCLKAAIDGNYKNGNYVVTIESIVPNLGLLREYKPLMKGFWRDGLFNSMDDRYFRLVNRSTDMQDEIDWSELEMEEVFTNFCKIFNNPANVKKEAYFDKMTHFDFKCLLPALLQVEDRMSMAHGLESRVPFLDHPIVEFAATIPADIKFKGGNMKYLIKKVFSNELPQEISNRRDKMGFPVPVNEWFNKELNLFIRGIFNNIKVKNRPYINAEAVLQNFDKSARFSRKSWALLSLELWHQQFHDRAEEWRWKA